MRPEKGDYAEYFDRYITLVEGEDIVQELENQLKTFEKFYGSLTEEQGEFAYAEGKWTIKEVIGHVIDTERIMAYRALAFARGEEKALPGFEQDDYVANSNAAERKLVDLINEYKTLRIANIAMFKSFSEKEFSRKGTASGNKVSVLALAFIIAGHELHHHQILKERYL
ncbi:MAG: DinB family protein [Ignavibacterium sp.]|nr:MAG: DinB family protein [Ignavibacterium sp.]